MRRALPALLALLPASAAAWQIEDPLHHSCHERITHDALGRVGYVRTPPALAGEDRKLPGSLELDASRYDSNLYALSLVLGVRYPDLHGAPGFDWDDLARTHNAPGDQGEHCLRSEEQDGPEGDEAALRDCRRTIERLYWDALASLDEAGGVDPDARELLDVAVPFAGTVRYPLSSFYANAGRALHAVQDSFTHTYRTPDQRRVVHVMNWVEQVSFTLDEARDGHGHETALDDCTLGDSPVLAPRLDAARVASADFLEALTVPGTVEERRARLEGFLDAWLSYEPGCAVDDAYCGSETHAWVMESGMSDAEICSCAGCGAAKAPPVGALGLLALGGAALLAAGGRKRRRGTGALAALAVLALAAPASAAPREEGLHLELRASMSVQNPAYAGGGAALWSWSRVELGGFAELNPWYSVEARRTSLGSTNAGLVAHYLHPIRDDVLLRAGLLGGLSILNEEMIGSDVGTTGVFLGLRLLGLVFQLDEDVALTVDAFDLALPAPQLTGWPVLYAQHRFSAGIQF